MNTPLVVGVDLGGTKMLAAPVDRAGRLGAAPVRFATGSARPGPAQERAVEDAIVSAVRATAGGREIAAVGLSAAGFIDAAGAVMRFAPHLPWREAPVRDRLAERLGCPVALENDATCAGVAEFRLGAAADTASMLLLTVGTGIGGAVGVTAPGGERFVWRGAAGMAGEFGHATAVPDGLECPCGLRGCWEQYCSGRALGRAALRHGATATGSGLTEAAAAGDPAALAAFAEVGAWLGAAIASACAGLDPERVVIGGGVSAAGEVLLAPAREELARRLVGMPHRAVPAVVGSHFGEQAGLVGGALVAHDLVG